MRLIDLRSGSSTHSLAGHSGSVLTVAWHPRNPNILASGAIDGCVRLWDIRRSASSLGTLDHGDSIGVIGHDGRGSGARRREQGKSHNGAVNGICWTEDGRYLISAGHDEQMRVWDMTIGSNTLVNFGPGLKNAQTTTFLPLLAPSHLSPADKEVLFYANPREILSFDVHSGALISRLRIPGPQGSQSSDISRRNLQARTTSLAWRAHSIEMYSGHGNGTIHSWRPCLPEDAILEQEETEEDQSELERKRKREELDQIVRDLTKRKTTYI